MNIVNWAKRHGVTPAALDELRAILCGVDLAPDAASTDVSESAIQRDVRIAASRLGWRLWRNNNGAGKLENGSFVRWGLANDSPTLNRNIKSADLIGIRPTLIGPEHVGHTVGIFASREIKRPGARRDDRFAAQVKWCELVNSLGGDAKIIDTVENMK